MSKKENKSVIKDGMGVVKKVPVGHFNGKPIRFNPGEIFLFCETLADGNPDGDLYIKHSKDIDGYNTQWYLKGESGRKKTRIVASKKSLAFDNKQRDNKLVKIAKEAFNIDAKDHITKAGEFINERESIIFPSEIVTLERSKKDTQLIEIAKELENDNKIVINRLTSELHIYNPMKGVYEPYNNTEFAAFLNRRYHDKFLMDEVVKIMGTFTTIKDESKNYLAFQNCLLNIETLETEDFNSDEFVTFQVPFNWDPEARSEFFETKLKEILIDDERYLLFLQILGYCFTHSNPHHKMFFLTGDGGNGKSTLMALIRSIFHSSVGAVGLHEFKNDFGLQPLLGKKINILYDLPKRKITDTGIIKAVTGEDLITVNRKHKEAVNTMLGCKIIGVGNQLPPVNDDTFAFWRRVIIIELTNKFNDPTIKDKLLTDVKGIEGLIYQSINAFKRVRSEGWAIKMSKGDIRRQYLLLSDPCLYAAEELFEKTNDPQDYVTRSDVVHLISEYLKSQGMDAPGNVKLYYTAIRSIGGDDSDRRIDGVKNRGFTFVKTKQVLEQQSDKELKNLAFWGNEEAQAELDYRKLNEIGEHSDEA
jgi:putative DNA primase/helicase